MKVPAMIACISAHRGRLLALIVVGSLGMLAVLQASPPQSAGAEVPRGQPAIDFTRQIRPILAENCFACHGPDKHKANLRLDTREGLSVRPASSVPVSPGPAR